MCPLFSLVSGGDDMAVLEFKTHLYKVFSKPGKVTIDANGDPVQSASQPTESDVYPCDIVEAGAPNTIATEDGKLVAYSYTVHGEAQSPELYNGQRIQILDKGQHVIFDGTIKGYSNKQLQTIIWV